MSTAIIIPARYASQRLPGKPLLRETGKYLIQHVYERAALSRKAAQVIVATDDARIADAVASFGGRATLTDPHHPSGTDRIAEAAQGINADIIVNLQGDEPMVEASTLDLLPTLLEDNPGVDAATVATPIRSREQWMSPSCVKVVCDDHGRALYFSRSPIPHVRDGAADFAASPPQFLLHLGLYAYRRDYLLSIARQPPAALEQLEKLEQLRILASGRALQVGIVDEASFGIDTPEDYQEFVEWYRATPLRRSA